MNELIKLSEAKLHSLHKHVEVPEYNRKVLHEGIVHIGVGGFHRAHQAFYTDELFRSNLPDGWGICGIGLREDDRTMYQALKEQDYLYTVLVKYPNGKRKPRVIGSIKNYILAPDNPKKAIEKMASKYTKIISLTITEGGYNINDSNGEFYFGNPDVQWDLKHREQPKTVFGYLAAAFSKRMADGLQGCTVLSCDNIQTNGDVTRNVILNFTKKYDTKLASWIEENVSFPNSMVDRITPVTTSEDIEELNKDFLIDDNWPVVCESFKQWIIEDDFINGRPQWEKVGVRFVNNVEPYEKMKLRLLNAGHSLLGIVGSLFGHLTIDEAIRDLILEKMLRRYFDEEVTPILGTIEGIDIGEYIESLIERFGNPSIKDQLTRICSESSAKLPKFLLPTIRDQINQEGPIELGTAIIGAWFRYLELDGKNETGHTYQIKDEMFDQLQQKIHESSGGDSAHFLQFEEVFGDLGKSDRFVKQYLSVVKNLRNHGARQTIKRLVNY